MLRLRCRCSHPSRPSAAGSGGCPQVWADQLALVCPPRPRHGHQVTRNHLRRIRSGRRQSERPEARKEADRFAVEAWNKRMLTFQGSGADITDAGRCDQHRIRLPSTPRAATEDNAGAFTETLHAMEGELAGSRLSILSAILHSRRTCRRISSGAGWVRNARTGGAGHG